MSTDHKTLNICECGGKNQYSYETIEDIAKFLKERISITPKLGIICGSGLGAIANLLNEKVTIDYQDIPNFPVSTVIGHAGRLHFGYIDSTPVVCMQGRFHFYEGNPLWKCVLPVRVFKLLGVTHMIVSNAAGGINRNFKVGDVMLIKDHINFLGLAGFNPLSGVNEERFGERFVPMNGAYNPGIIEKAKLVAKKLGMEGICKEGVYCCVGGPNYETVAELRALEVMGVDAVGMSTVHEVIAARHCGIVCFGFSLITNKAVMDYESTEAPSGDEVIEMAKTREKHLQLFVREVIKVML